MTTTTNDSSTPRRRREPTDLEAMFPPPSAEVIVLGREGQRIDQNHGPVTDAVARFKRAIKLAGDSIHPHTALLHLHLAHCYIRLYRQAEAETPLRKAHEILQKVIAQSGIWIPISSLYTTDEVQHLLVAICATPDRLPGTFITADQLIELFNHEGFSGFQFLRSLQERLGISLEYDSVCVLPAKTLVTRAAGQLVGGVTLILIALLATGVLFGLSYAVTCMWLVSWLAIPEAYAMPAAILTAYFVCLRLAGIVSNVGESLKDKDEVTIRLVGWHLLRHGLQSALILAASAAITWKWLLPMFSAIPVQHHKFIAFATTFAIYDLVQPLVVAVLYLPSPLWKLLCACVSVARDRSPRVERAGSHNIMCEQIHTIDSPEPPPASK